MKKAQTELSTRESKVISASWLTLTSSERSQRWTNVYSMQKIQLWIYKLTPAKTHGTDRSLNNLGLRMGVASDVQAFGPCVLKAKKGRKETYSNRGRRFMLERIRLN